MNNALLLVAILAMVVEAICEFLFLLATDAGNIFHAKITPDDWAKYWKPIFVMALSVLGAMLLKVDLFGLYFPTLVFPYVWIGSLFTGILLGSGADLIHILKQLANPPVQV